MADLWWLMLALGVAVFVVFAVFLALGLFRPRPAETPLGREEPHRFSAWMIGAGVAVPLVIKGTALLGVRAVLAESFERIYRSNLIGMGVLPLQYLDGQSAATLGLSGREVFDIPGADVSALGSRIAVRADGREFEVDVRIDTQMELEYYRQGGILPYVLRSLARDW